MSIFDGHRLPSWHGAGRPNLPPCHGSMEQTHAHRLDFAGPWSLLRVTWCTTAYHVDALAWHNTIMCNCHAGMCNTHRCETTLIVQVSRRGMLEAVGVAIFSCHHVQLSSQLNP
ncbi:hypothetical protein HAX54_043483, partial [Datura stramonium]|nr:hypothetical protein [Datura stramonium]